MTAPTPDLELVPAAHADDGAALRVPLGAVLDDMVRTDPAALVAASGKTAGPPRDVAGAAMVPVLFASRASASQRILVHLSGYTDQHRADHRPSLLEPEACPGVQAAVFMLPTDGIISYRIADVTGLPHDIGTTRPGWQEVHRRGRPDPGCPDVLPTPLGGDASVWCGPDAPTWAWPSEEREQWSVVDVGDRHVRVLPGDDRVVVLLDGQYWLPLATGSGLRRAGCQHTVVQIPSRSEDREAEMTRPDAAAALLRRALHAAGRALGRDVHRAHAVAGQSFGGLAVALLAQHAPALLEHAIVQSGSFWYPERGADLPGECVRSLRSGAGDVSTPVVLQVGTQEGEMVTLARAYRDALRERDAEVSYREVRGGHDYAWWRYGLVEALREIDETEAPSEAHRNLGRACARALPFL